MAKVVQFPSPTPEKFGFKPVRKRKASLQKKPGQLNLFEGGRIVKLNQLSSFEEALMLDEQNDPRAKDLYLRAIEEKDGVVDSYCNLGILESEDNNHSKAIGYFTLCLKEEPRHFEAHYNLANLYAEIGNYPLAKVHYQMSIEVEPEFPNSHFNLGLTYAMNREIEEAIQSLLSYRKLAAPEDRHYAEELISNLSRTITK